MIRLYLSRRILNNMQLEEQRHYITKVYRLRTGDKINLFNENDGEFVFQIEKIDSTHVYCTKLEPVKRNEQLQNISIAIPLIKPARLEIAIEKATEIGVKKIFLINTERCIGRQPDIARLKSIVQSAVQQSRRLLLPEIVGPIDLSDLIKTEHNILLCDLKGEKIHDVKLDQKMHHIVLVGPEGGFTEQEKVLLKDSLKVSLLNSECVLRTETAAIVGLSCVMQLLQGR